MSAGFPVRIVMGSVEVMSWGVGTEDRYELTNASPRDPRGDPALKVRARDSLLLRDHLDRTDKAHARPFRRVTLQGRRQVLAPPFRHLA